MELSILLLKKIEAMAIIMMVGFVLRKKDIVKNEQIPVLSALILYGVGPCIVFNSFLMPYSSTMFQAFLISMAGGVFSQIFFIFLGWCMKKSPFHASPTEQACLAYTNCGNLLVPLINSLLGKEYVFYSVSFLASNVICCWLHMAPLISGNSKRDFKKILINPNIIASVGGMIVFCFGIQLPQVLLDSIDSMSGSVGVISMLLTGMLLAGIDLKSVFTSIRYIELSLLRLVAFPLVLIILFRLTGACMISDIHREVLMVVVMGGAAPTATGVLSMCNMFGGEAEKASAISAMSTVLCIVTLPFIVFIYQLVC